MELFANIWSIEKGDSHVLFYGLPLNDIVSLVSVVGLLITLYMSLKALRESSRANALAYLPILTLKHKKVPSRGVAQQMVVENIGNGIALNVRVDSYYQSFIDDLFHSKKANHYVLRVEPIDVLKNSENEVLETGKSTVGGLIDAELMIFKIFNSSIPLTFYIRFQDISGTDYISKIIISASNTQVAGRPKRYNLGRKFLYISYRAKEQITLRFNRLKANRKQSALNKKREAAKPE